MFMMSFELNSKTIPVKSYFFPLIKMLYTGHIIRVDYIYQMGAGVVWVIPILYHHGLGHIPYN